MNENEPADAAELAGKPIKKTRQSPHRWLAFFYLRKLEIFFLGVHTCRKENFLEYSRLFDGKRCWIAPWRKVRTSRHVRNEQGEHGGGPRVAQ